MPPLLPLVRAPSWLAIPAALLALAVQAPALAATSSADGVSFSHHDWELACDNTRTCRAAGYQSDEGDVDEGEPVRPVSLLLTRLAGPAQRVQARVALGSYGDEDEAASAPALAQRRLNLRVNGRALGALPWLAADQGFGLTPAQLAAVLQALPRARARIEFVFGPTVWRLSDRGAAAVLLKMDEAQGRVGTPGALARPGSRPESEVLPPLPVPVVKAVRVPAARSGDVAQRLPGLSAPAMAALRQVLVQQAGDARELPPPDEPEPPFTFQPLGGGHWLARTLCWSAAYNQGHCMWVLNERPPHQPRLVTDSASDFEAGEITAAHKGRGLGDCWSLEAWAWDGRDFALTRRATTGQCKLITPGGAWDLPTWVTRVVGRD